MDTNQHSEQWLYFLNGRFRERTIAKLLTSRKTDFVYNTWIKRPDLINQNVKRQSFSSCSSVKTETNNLYDFGRCLPNWRKTNKRSKHRRWLLFRDYFTVFSAPVSSSTKKTTLYFAECIFWESNSTHSNCLWGNSFRPHLHRSLAFHHKLQSLECTLPGPMNTRIGQRHTHRSHTRQ